MSKEFISKIKIIMLGLFVTIAVSFASASYSGTSSLNTNTSIPLNTSATGQSKGKTCTPTTLQSCPTTGTLLDINGLVNASSLAVWGDVSLGKYNSGDLYLTQFKDTTGTAQAKRPLCIDILGKISLCNIHIADYITPGTDTFTVPNGVTSITVEVWGAGGAGGENYSPTVGSSYANTNGQASKFKYCTNTGCTTFDTSKLNIVANGGNVGKGDGCTTYGNNCGSGGTTSVSGNLISTTITNATGSSGGDSGLSTTGSSQKYLCSVNPNGNSANYWKDPNYKELWKPGDGYNGGDGGQSGSNTGGAGGIGGVSQKDFTVTNGSGTFVYTLNSSTCSSLTSSTIAQALVDSINNFGENLAYGTFLNYKLGSPGSDASNIGGGGGGAGGFSARSKNIFGDLYTTNGWSDPYNSTTKENGLCNDDNGSGTYNKPICNANGKGTGGGGGGGYVKTVISVTGGQVYQVTVGDGGQMNTSGYAIYYACNLNQGGHSTCGYKTGSGHSGEVKVTY